tara:strand:- start:522 stop:632 length:111 start_codon:yes stop_codon:yes gene_type:complete
MKNHFSTPGNILLKISKNPAHFNNLGFFGVTITITN